MATLGEVTPDEVTSDQQYTVALYASFIGGTYFTENTLWTQRVIPRVYITVRVCNIHMVSILAIWIG